MGSLDKAVNEGELLAWAARCDELGKKASLESITSDLFVTEKLDGLSRGTLRDAGDGAIGERILSNAADEGRAGEVEPRVW